MTDTAVCETSQIKVRAQSPKFLWSTPAAVDRLKELHERKLSCSQIAVVLFDEFQIPVSRNAVIGKINRLGLLPHSPPGFSEKSRERRQTAQFRIRTKPVTVELPPTPPTIAEPLHITFMDLQHGQCRFPFGNGPFTFCGCDVAPGRSYCWPHAMVCSNPYIAMSEAERRSAAQRRAWAAKKAREGKAA